MNGRVVRSQSMRDDDFGLDVLCLQSASQESKSSSSVAPLLHDHVQHVPFVVGRAPDPHTLAGDHRNHVIEMATRRRRRFSTTETGSDRRATLYCPIADCLAASIDAAMSERLLDITQTPRETETEPSRMLNHGRWEAVTFMRKSRHWGLPQANSHGLCRDCLALV